MWPTILQIVTLLWLCFQELRYSVQVLDPSSLVSLLNICLGDRCSTCKPSIAASSFLLWRLLKETWGSVLPSRRAGLVKWHEAREEAGLAGIDVPPEDGSKRHSQRIRWKIKSDEERESLAKMIGISVYRPFRESISYL